MSTATKQSLRLGYSDQGDLRQPGQSYSKLVAIVTACSANRLQLDVRVVWGSNHDDADRLVAAIREAIFEAEDTLSKKPYLSAT